MSNISLNVSTEYESRIEVTPLTGEGDCMSVSLVTNIEGYKGEPLPYALDHLFIHGSIADIRKLAELMLASLPKLAESEPIVETEAATT